MRNLHKNQNVWGHDTCSTPNQMATGKWASSFNTERLYCCLGAWTVWLPHTWVSLSETASLPTTIILETENPLIFLQLQQIADKSQHLNRNCFFPWDSPRQKSRRKSIYESLELNLKKRQPTGTLNVGNSQTWTEYFILYFIGRNTLVNYYQ